MKYPSYLPLGNREAKSAMVPLLHLAAVWIISLLLILVVFALNPECLRAGTPKSGRTDGVDGPVLSGDRHPLYRLNASDVVELTFAFAPEFNQAVTGATRWICQFERAARDVCGAHDPAAI